MKKQCALFAIAVIALVAFVSFALATQEAKPQDEKISKDMCLACHGPFEKIAKATENYKTPSEEVSTPHKYIPHDSQDIPECTECHIQHKIPLEDKSTVVRPKDLEFCYAGCHHMRNLQSCTACH